MSEEKPTPQPKVETPVTPNTTIQPPVYDTSQHTHQGGDKKIIIPNEKK